MNIWQDGTKSIPKNTDKQIVRTPMDQIDIAGRKDHLPNRERSEAGVQHVPNKG